MTTYRKSMREALNEVYLGENNMNLLKKAAGGAMQTLKMKDGKVKMDSFTASAIMQVYKAINPKNKKTMENVVNTGTISALQKLQALAMRAIKSGDEVEHDGEELDESPRDAAATEKEPKLSSPPALSSKPSLDKEPTLASSKNRYDLYHKDFSSAMQHSYKMAKKMYGITIDPKEIDDKVASGPRKPSEGKTNKYRLKGDKGAIQVQVYNKGGSKPFELNMYKEEVELDEAVKVGDTVTVRLNRKGKEYIEKGKVTKIEKDSIIVKHDFSRTPSRVLMKNIVKEEVELDEDMLPLFFALWGTGAMVVLPALMIYDVVNRSTNYKLDAKVGETVGKLLSKFKKDKNYKPNSAEIDASKKLEKEVKSKEPSIFKKAMSKLKSIKSKKEEVELDESKKALQNKADKSGVSYGILKKVYDRGMAAYKTGHRPGTTPQQWALARVNSFLTGGGARKADADLWKQAKGQKEEVELDEAQEQIKQLEKMLKDLEKKKKKTPGDGYAKMKIKELLADLKSKKEEVELDEGRMRELMHTIHDKLEKEGGAAGFADLKKAAKSMGVNLTPDMLKDMPKVKQHRNGDYILENLKEDITVTAATDGGISQRDLDYAQKELRRLGIKDAVVDQNEMDKNKIDVQTKMSDDKVKKAFDKSKMTVNYESARADARRAMRNDPVLGKRSDKDDDDDEATAADQKAASKNILIQLQKVLSLKGGELRLTPSKKKATAKGNYGKTKGDNYIEFSNGKKEKIDPKIAQAVFKKYMSIRRPIDKQKFTIKISKSYKDMLSALKEGFASDAQRRAAFAQGYKAKGKKGKKEEIVKEGTWALPDSPKLMAGLKKLMQKPIPLGKDGDDAIKAIGKYIGDDGLYDDLYDAGKKDGPKADARPVISGWMDREFVGSWKKYRLVGMGRRHSTVETTTILDRIDQKIQERKNG